MVVRKDRKTRRKPVDMIDSLSEETIRSASAESKNIKAYFKFFVLYQFPRTT